MNQNLVGCLSYTASRCPGRGGVRGRQRGFTLIELVMVMVMLGVLAVFAAPRVFNRNDFDARGFHDQTLGVLRFAQKTAIAQRRSVCVAFTNNSIALTIASAAGDDTCSAALNGPTGKTVLTAPASVTYSALPADFRFDGLGQPLTGSGIGVAAPRAINVTNAVGTITVEAATGYVHD